MYNTVQELMAQIKGWEYLLAFAFLGLFLGGWLTIGRERTSREEPQEAHSVATSAPPCWEVHDCPSEVKEKCPAHALSPLPCWVARPLAEGKRVRSCVTCPTYVEGMERVVEAAKNRAPVHPSPGAGRAA